MLNQQTDKCATLCSALNLFFCVLFCVAACCLMCQVQVQLSCNVFDNNRGKGVITLIVAINII